MRERERKLNLRHQRSPWLRAWCLQFAPELGSQTRPLDVDPLSWLFTSIRRAPTDTGEHSNTDFLVAAA